MSWIAAGAAVAGAYMNMRSQSDTNDAASLANDRAYERAKHMRRTAHQAEVADLMDAGLNPNLSAGGSGASTPNMPAAPVQAPQIDLPGIINAVQLSQQERKLDMEEQRLGITSAKAGPEIDNKKADTGLKKMETRLKGKGIIRADVESEGAQVLRHLLNNYKKELSTTQEQKNQQTLEQFKKMPGTSIWGQP